MNFQFFDMQERQWWVGMVGNCPPKFGIIEGTAGQWRRDPLLLATHILIAIDAPELCITTLPKCV